MNTTALKHVRELFNVPLAPTHVNRHNQRQWVRSIRLLGDKWVLAEQVTKNETFKPKHPRSLYV